MGYPSYLSDTIPSEYAVQRLLKEYFIMNLRLRAISSL